MHSVNSIETMRTNMSRLIPFKKLAMYVIPVVRCLQLHYSPMKSLRPVRET